MSTSPKSIKVIPEKPLRSRQKISACSSLWSSLSMARADAPEVLHLPTTIAKVHEIFLHLVEADEFSPAESRIVGKLLVNPAAITTVRRVNSSYSVHFDTGGSVTVLSVPLALAGIEEGAHAHSIVAPQH
jgi:hypothetical protein